MGVLLDFWDHTMFSFCCYFVLEKLSRLMSALPNFLVVTWGCELVFAIDFKDHWGFMLPNRFGGYYIGEGAIFASFVGNEFNWTILLEAKEFISLGMFLEHWQGFYRERKVLHRSIPSQLIYPGLTLGDLNVQLVDAIIVELFDSLVYLFVEIFEDELAHLFFDWVHGFHALPTCLQQRLLCLW